MKIQDVLFTGIGVRLVSKVEVLVDNTELNCWRKRLLDTGKRRHVSNSDLKDSRCGSDVLTERSHNILHFISCWFHQRSWHSQNHFEMR